MEKGTQKFLSILLCIAILFCFPVVSQAAEKSYQETFTGTYTAPEAVKNVLVSGSDAAISQWYGDRVNIGGHTYSVRQNEYGLNKDGNMIKMELGKSYTVWLAQYGVASFAFTADDDGTYVFKASETSAYKSYLESLNNIQYNNIFYPTLSLVQSEYGRVKDAFGSEYYSPYREEESPSIIFDVEKGETVYIAAGDNENMADYCYDVSVTEYTKENCTHEWEYKSTDYDKCKEEDTYQCKYCGEIDSRERYFHDWDYIYTHKATNCLDYSSGTRTCSDCGAKEEFTYNNDGEHQPASKEIDYIGYWEIEYRCVCSVCGRTYCEYNDSPCYNEFTGEVHHSFGDRDSLDISCGQTVTCTTCGYVYEGDHDYETTRIVTPITESGKCYTVTYTETCKKCGETYTESYSRHRAWEYVQVTPQHDNVCGTYNFACADCGALKFDSPLTCHSNTYSWDTCSHSEICRRCGNTEKYEYHDFDNGKYIAPTCKANGGTLYTCLECGATKLENAVPSLGHNFANNSPACLNCGIANPNYVAPSVPTTPTAPVTTPTAPVTTPPATDTSVKSTSLKSLTGGKKEFKAAWKKAENAEGYQLQYSTDKSFKKGTKTITVKATSKTVSNLKENTVYYVRVRAYKTVNGKNDYTAWSKAQSVVTAAPPKATSTNKPKAGKKQISVSWKKSSNAAGYEIQYSTDKNFKKGNKSVTVKGKNSTSTTLKDLKSKKTYYVRVRSYKTVKVKGKATKVYSSWSKVKTVKTK